ncbi:MAG TPA: serine/threonine-protein kinase, partial [Nannocystis sp.]
MRAPGDITGVDPGDLRTRPLAPDDLPLPPKPASAVSPIAEPALVVPPRIRHFTVLQKVGQGGMGVVYSAYDNELDRKVAIKLLQPSHDGSLGAARLHREAQAMARLTHPNIVRVYEVGELEGAHHLVYLVMEFVQGETLRRWWRKARRSWREVLAVMSQAGRGLAAAHAAGLVHRDFKPDNVIVADDGFVRVLDFGLARSFEAPEPAPASAPQAPMMLSSMSLSDQLTQAGTVIGTPAYMSPEQFSSRIVDAHSDQFSFCVVFYEALYGHRPFKAQTGAELHLAIGLLQHAEPPRKTGVPARLRKIVLRGLSAAPQDRWPSMQALLDELAREPGKQARLWLAGGAIAAVAAGLSLTLAPRAAVSVCQDAPAKFAGLWDDARKAEVERNLLATGVADAADIAARVQRQLDDYTARWTAMYRESCEATQLRGEQSAQLMDLQMACLHQRRTDVALLVDLLARADATVMQRVVPATLSLGRLDRCADNEALTAEVPPPEDPVQAVAVAAAREKLARVKVTFDLGQYDVSRAIIEEVVREAAVLGYPPLHAEALLRQGDLVDRSGDTVTAERLWTDAYFLAGVARDDRSQAAAATNLAFLAGAERGRYSEALLWDRHAQMLLSRLGDPVDLQIARLNTMGAMMERWGKYAEGQKYLERALVLAEPRADVDPINLATVLLNSGGLYLGEADYAAAERQYNRSLEIFTRLFGPNNSATADCLNNIGHIALLRADLPAAQAYFERALATYEKSVGAGHPRLAYPLVNLGAVALALRNYDAARQHLTRALVLLEATRGVDDPQIAEPTGALAELAAAQADWDEAERQAQRALLRAGGAEGEDRPDHIQPLTALGEAALGRKNFTRAGEHFHRALEV